MQPDPACLLEILGITPPLVGLYDAPDASSFEPLARPEPRKHFCVFEFYENWRNGETLRLSRDAYGCPGAGRYLCGVNARSRDALVEFLVDCEGLKDSRELMNAWIDSQAPYRQEHADVFIGPLRGDQYAYLKTVAFFVTPDQLSALILGAHYHAGPGEPPPVIAPFGAGCMQMVSSFSDLNIPQALVGATDIAMRRFLPPDLAAFVVTKPMFERLCRLDERSFLHKPFWKNLRKARQSA